MNGILSPDLWHISISNAISRAAIVVHLSEMTCSVMTGAVFSFRMPFGRGYFWGYFYGWGGIWVGIRVGISQISWYFKIPPEIPPLFDWRHPMN